MTLHFAYGSNMSRLMMRSHAPHARPLGVATLQGFRFLIMTDGYASVERAIPETVYGVLWRITPRDRVTLDTWENIEAGLYRAEMLPVRYGGKQVPALIYLGRTDRPGRPKPGYMKAVIEAARDWELPPDYIRSLEAWSPAPWLSARAGKTGGIG
jgi:hypothetical protein